ncbi:MAG: MBL fold metallo-hydrolase [Candidatus Sumerlaeia bacterium]|nr:MBL fold metallo-hydrolase [Candidatus Sumerlaeia bacterium]
MTSAIAATGPLNAGHVQIAGQTASVRCGQTLISLDAARGFSLSASAVQGQRQLPLITSTTIRCWIAGQEQTLRFGAQATALALVEEGPQRIVLQAPFTLTGSDGWPLGNAQYDLVLYPEGEVFLTFRLFPLRETTLDAAVEVRFAANSGLGFERPHTLPLIAASYEGGAAGGLYWHAGDAPRIAMFGRQMACIFPCYLEGGGKERQYTRSFVISIAKDGAQLRQRCRAHIEPLRPSRLDGCRPMIEQTPEARALAEHLPNWCYSYRDGTYNIFADSPEAVMEFYNTLDDIRRIRLRVVANTVPALVLTRDKFTACRAAQIVSLTPDIEPGRPGLASATLAAFDLAGHETMTVTAARSNRLLLQWEGARVAASGITRFCRLVAGDPPLSLGRIRIEDSGHTDLIELCDLAAPSSPSAPAVASCQPLPAASAEWGQFARLDQLVLACNQPDRVVLRVGASNEAGSLSCQSDLVFRGEGGVLSVYGYQTLHVQGRSPSGRPSVLDFPRWQVRRAGAATVWPQRFFYADQQARVQICPRAPETVFGYDIGAFNRTVHRDYVLCGFMGATSAGVAIFARAVTGQARMAAVESSSVLSLRHELPASGNPTAPLQSFWKLILPGTGQTNLRQLQVSLSALKGKPVDLAWRAGHFAVSDGRIAHRIYELSPSGNPAADDPRCYLLDGGSELAVIGAGCDDVRWPWLFRIRAFGLDSARIRRILLVHAGVGHSGGAAELWRLTSAAVSAHESAVEALSVVGPDQEQRTGVANHLGERTFESVEVSRPLRDGDTLTVGDLKVQFVHAPGPSGEHGIYLVNVGGLKTTFVGNLLSAAAEETDAAEGCADAHPHGNLNEWLRSLKMLRDGQVDLVAGDSGAPIAGTADINAACDLAMSRIKILLDQRDADYGLPRGFVLSPDGETFSSHTIVRRDLWGVKELERSPFERTEPFEIAPGLWRVGGGFTGEDADANVYLVDGGGEMALIGAGSGFHTGAIVQRLLAIGKNPLNVKYILLPSSHWYEARGAALLRAATHGRVCAHRSEVGALWRGDPIRTGLMIGDFHFADFMPCRADHLLQWGETLRVGSREIIVLDAPGFHRGSTAFFMTFGGRRYLATGQTVLGDLPTADGRLISGALGWPDPHWGSCLAQWRETLERFLSLRPDVLLPGQGPVEEEDPAARLRECIARLDALTKSPGAPALFPASLLDSKRRPSRPDISGLISR